LSYSASTPRTHFTRPSKLPLSRIPGHTDLIAAQFDVSTSILSIKGQILHIRGLTSWMVHSLFQKIQYPDSPVLMRGRPPDHSQYSERNRSGVMSRWCEIRVRSRSVTKVPPYPLQHSPHCWHSKNSERGTTSETLPPLHGSLKGYFVKVLEVTSNRDTSGYSRDTNGM
jgi:hypothetical protein